VSAKPVVRGLFVVALLAAAVVAASTAGDGRNEGSSAQDAPQDDTREIVDEASGVAYRVPAGWDVPSSDDLIYFTSVAGQGDVFVGVGPFESTFYRPSAEGLASASRGLAESMAEFFYPSPGNREVLVDESVRLDGVEAWRIRFRVDFENGEPSVTVEAIATAAGGERYVFSAAPSADEEALSTVAEVLESVELTD
jgi:hypothetical protein